MTITPAKKLFVAAAAVVGIAVAGAAPGAHAISLSDIGLSVDGKVMGQDSSQTTHVDLRGQNNLQDTQLTANTGNRMGDGRTDAGVTVLTADNLKNVFGTASFSHDSGMGTTNDGRVTAVSQDFLKNLLLQGSYFGTNPDGSVQSGDLGVMSQDYLKQLQGAVGVFNKDGSGNVTNVNLSTLFQ